MKLLNLYKKDFACYDTSFIVFTVFNSAVIIGKVTNNTFVSNRYRKI